MVYNHLPEKRTGLVTMIHKKLFVFYFFLLVSLSACSHSGQKHAIQDSLIHYELVKDWPALPDSFILGNPTSIGVDTHQNIFVFHRADRKWPLTPDAFFLYFFKDDPAIGQRKWPADQ